jgi:ribonuclease Z
MRMSANKVKRSKIRAIFISHLHGDHVFGLPGLLTSMSLSGHKGLIEVFGPPGIKGFIEDTLSYTQSQLGFQVQFHELNPLGLTEVFTSKHLSVYAFPLKHRIPTCGYLFKELPKLRGLRKDKIEQYNIPVDKILEIKSGADFHLQNGEVISNEFLTIDPSKPVSFAYCTDTVFDPEIISFINSVDLLYHEATFCNDMQSLAEERFHSTAQDAARIAHLAGVGKLVIGHFSSRYKDLEIFEEEARQVFENTDLAIEGRLFEIKS